MRLEGAAVVCLLANSDDLRIENRRVVQRNCKMLNFKGYLIEKVLIKQKTSSTYLPWIFEV